MGKVGNGAFLIKMRGVKILNALIVANFSRFTLTRLIVKVHIFPICLITEKSETCYERHVKLCSNNHNTIKQNKMNKKAVRICKINIRLFEIVR